MALARCVRPKLQQSWASVHCTRSRSGFAGKRIRSGNRPTGIIGQVHTMEGKVTSRDGSGRAGGVLDLVLL
ncbi:TonB-dependent receptor [Anopheles sinensis]|uniref:TonB-dependent receptor n=1 Tax=Anopheles sinensis TaxID=74873 RepID=A0A084WC39_ANOSI|nr:TonB-dependent receptor [Anopheles sinensis]